MSYLSIPQFSPFFSAGMRLMLGCLFLGLAQPVTAQENTLEFNETEGLDVTSGAENEITFEENEGLEVGGEGSDSAVDAASDAVSHAVDMGNVADAQEFLDRVDAADDAAKAASDAVSDAVNRGNGASAVEFLDRAITDEAMKAASDAVSDAVLDGQVSDAELFAAPDLVLEGEATDLCGRPGGSDEALEVLENMLGSWLVKNQALVVTVNGMPMPVPGGPVPEVQGAILEVTDGQLYMVDPSGETPPVPMRWATGESWIENAPKALKAGFLSGDDKALLKGGCRDDQLPRLVGNADFPLGGTVMHTEIRLIPTDMRRMVGDVLFRIQDQGMTVRALRFIELTR
ncbi:hypothetical protein [Profundibacter sp.]